MPTVRRVVTLVAAVALLVASAVPALAGDALSTGLERAREVAAEGLEKAQQLSHGPDGDEATGLQRAAEAITAALARGNGTGHGYGRGHAATVLEILAAGGTPSEIAGEHGAAVRQLVHAYNELRKQDG